MSRSVLTRFRSTGVVVLTLVIMLAAGFYGWIHQRYVGSSMSRMLGPFSDALAEVGFSDADPSIWRRIAERHQVALVVERDGVVEAYDRRGVAVARSEVGETQLRAVRTHPAGGRVTFFWSLDSDGGSALPTGAALLTAIGIVVAVAFWYLQQQLLPLTRLQRGVEAVAAGNFEIRVAVEREDEIGRVARAFNEMAAQVGDMVERRERLLADVSHELRSPITRMKVALELLEPSRQGAEVDLRSDLEEMEGLVGTLLERELVRHGHGVPEELILLDLEVLLTAEGERDRSIEVCCDGPMQVRGDPDLLRILLRNLLENAAKCRLHDSRATVLRGVASGSSLTVEVIDDGPGVAAGGEKEIFEPFHKAEASRGHHRGYGLGLDLCRRIARLHGGSVRIERLAPRGLKAIVELPAATPRDG